MPKYVYDVQTGQMTEEEVLPGDIIPRPIAELRAEAIREVARQADAQRGKIISLSPGKIGEYTQKQRSYDLWVASNKHPNPPPGKYKIAEAEAQIRGITLAAMLQTWGTRAEEWEAASALICAVEVSAGLAIGLATTDEAINLIVSGLDWPF